MTGKGADQRRSVRVLTPFTAVLLEKPGPEALSLIDLSTGGALISSSRDLHKDDTVRLVMSLGSAGPVALDAQVVRGPCGHGDSSEFALTFVELDEPVVHLLTETVLSHLSARLREVHREVLVIDRSSAVRRSIRDALDLFGVHDISEGTSPLDAVTRLLRAPTPYLTSFVGAPAGEIGAVELATFIMDEYPHTRVVLLIPTAEPATAGAAPQEHRTDLAILAPPWTPDRVASFVLPRRSPAASG